MIGDTHDLEPIRQIITRVLAAIPKRRWLRVVYARPRPDCSPNRLTMDRRVWQERIVRSRAERLAFEERATEQALARRRAQSGGDAA